MTGDWHVCIVSNHQTFIIIIHVEVLSDIKCIGTVKLDAIYMASQFILSILLTKRCFSMKLSLNGASERVVFIRICVYYCISFSFMSHLVVIRWLDRTFRLLQVSI